MPDLTALLAPDSGGEEEDPQDIISESESDTGSVTNIEPEHEQNTDNAFPKLDSEDDEVEVIAATKSAGKKRSGNTFNSMGLSRLLLSNIQRKGFKTPTPIQRKAIPLMLDGEDVVGMARTGSGKTAAFVVPMLDRLKTHSARVGIRALILSPSRELAFQTLRTVREFGRKTELRSVLLVGGDSMDDQFSMMLENPDIVIATPGRFLHLKVEMRLDLSTVEYVVFDEADRLFEMGFSEQLNEILSSLPETRQTSLFSATLPASLVEFTKAGLRNPQLVRLDSEQKISEQLEMAFFAVKDAERDASLLYLLASVIKIPLASKQQKEYLKKRESFESIEKREKTRHDGIPTAQSTIVFVPTKHHVEYIARLLRHEGYAVSYIYGSLDQAARREQLYLFSAGKTSILVVTDVAARGVDIPMLANVVNYNLPTSPRAFVHRVGRTARAGNTGWAYSLVRDMDLAYLADLEVFLGRSVRLGDAPNYTQFLVIGSLPRPGVEFQDEQLRAVIDRDYDLSELRKVAARGERLWQKSREPASRESVRKANDWVESSQWDVPHCLTLSKDQSAEQAAEQAKADFLSHLANRRSRETVFEFKKSGASDAAHMMARRRAQLAPIQEKHKLKRDQATIPVGSSKDSEFYMSHYEPTESLQDRGYSITGSAGFADLARTAGFSVDNEGVDYSSKQVKRWDKKHGKYVTANSDTRYIRDENGRKIPASLRTGRFDAWQREHKVAAPLVGSIEEPNSGNMTGAGRDRRVRKFHRKEKAPKLPDKARDDYKKQKEKYAKAMEKGVHVKGASQPRGLKPASQIAKERSLKQQRWEKSNQPTKRRRK